MRLSPASLSCLLTCAILAVCLPSQGQTTTDYVAKFGSSGTTNTSAPIFDHAGNVGIGTTTPLDLLNLKNGAFRVTASDGSVHGWMLPYGSGSNMFVIDVLNADNSQKLNLGLMPWGGKVAIGMAPGGTPRASLDIVGPSSSFLYIDSGGNTGTSEVGLFHVFGGTTQQKVAILSDSTGAWGKGNLRLAVNTANDVSNVSVGDTKLYIDGNTGMVGIGTTSPLQALDVSGDIRLSGGGWGFRLNPDGADGELRLRNDQNSGQLQLHVGALVSDGPIQYPDGSKQTTAWTGVLCGGDYAESVDVAGDRHQYGPGDVLQIDKQDPSRFERVAEPYSTGVAGVFSTRPGAVGRRQTTPKNPDELPLAIVGIVPVKVTAENGPIHPRDLLVSSSKAGYAMRGTDRTKMLGAVIGKAMGSLDKGEGVIEVLVTLQ